MLAAQKVFPQEVACPEEPREEGKGFLVADEVECLVFAFLARFRDDKIEKVVEGCQCLGRVGRPG
jgi:hypothetical protein